MNPSTGGSNDANRIQKWTAGPDWFRTIVTEPRKQKEAIDAIRIIQSEDANKGHKLRPWGFQGFKGMASGSVRWGIRDWRLLWECSGEITPFTMTRLGGFIGSGKRIDLQLTLDFTSQRERFGRSCLRPRTRT